MGDSVDVMTEEKDKFNSYIIFLGTAFMKCHKLSMNMQHTHEKIAETC